MLDHPEPPFDVTRLNIIYSNPHHPPPGGYGRSGAFARQLFNKWTVQTNSKSVEVQRSQVDEVFKSLKSGDDLEETAARKYLVQECLINLFTWSVSFGYQYKALSTSEKGSYLSSGP